MISVLLVSSKNQGLMDLAIALAKEQVAITRAYSGAGALSMISNTMFDLVLSDEMLEDMTGLALIGKMVSVNPLVNSAVVSSLSAKDVHEASEGLGVLMPLPLYPGEKHAVELLGRLKNVLQLTTKQE